jgi:hypothetical protein
MLSDDSRKKILKKVSAHNFSDVQEPRDIKIHPSRAADMIEHYHTNG